MLRFSFGSLKLVGRMTVEGQRGGFVVEDGATDPFPVGMRVLAVDDDPICLKVIENLLRKCQYHGWFVFFFISLVVLNFMEL